MINKDALADSLLVKWIDMPQPKRRLRPWFDRGSEAASNVFPSRKRGYICPLCFQTFDSDDLDQKRLSSDHVPPNSLGGHRLVLTCKDCNSAAGSGIDVAMLQYDQRLDYELGVMIDDDRIPARFTFDGQTLNVEVRASGSKVTIYDLPRNNDPSVFEAIDSELRRQYADENIETIQFELNYPRNMPDEWDVALGWLRVAYLVAFAVFGYRYIVSPALSLVREQLTNPATHIIDRFFVIDVTAATGRDHWEILGILEPLTIRCVMVRVGRYCIILPPWDASENFYEHFDHAELSRLSSEGLLNKSLLRVPWPTQPQYFMDVPVAQLLAMADEMSNRESGRDSG